MLGVMPRNLTKNQSIVVSLINNYKQTDESETADYADAEKENFHCCFLGLSLPYTRQKNTPNPEGLRVSRHMGQYALSGQYPVG
jgi:hypothetical protein